MAKYRKKPVVIEAVQWFPGVTVPGTEVVERPEQVPTGALRDTNLGKGTAAYVGGFSVCLPYIMTLEGPLHVSPGDWIIRGAKGEFYPCKSDIFEATYEPVEEVDHV